MSDDERRGDAQGYNLQDIILTTPLIERAHMVSTVTIKTGVDTVLYGFIGFLYNHSSSGLMTR